MNDQQQPADSVDQLFAIRVRLRREELGLSQSEVGRRMADRGFPFHQTTVKRLEAGERVTRLGEAKALAEILRVSLSMLIAEGEGGSTAGGELVTLRSELEELNAKEKQLRARAAALDHHVNEAVAERHEVRQRLETLWLRQAELSGRFQALSEGAGDGEHREET
ncbi:MAG TPA: helix-turn-helix transcriptional regulator [Nocardioides sp.]|uniref:helix-turn-helix domain-containing protein n=1 Tax=Nocardioides sp. TaxID=35761 RepID=UPI002EDAE52F